MSSLDGFWRDVDAALDKIAQAVTVDQVINVLNEHFTASSGDAFFGGSGGDRTVWEALVSSGGGSHGPTPTTTLWRSIPAAGC